MSIQGSSINLNDARPLFDSEIIFLFQNQSKIQRSAIETCFKEKEPEIEKINNEIKKLKPIFDMKKNYEQGTLELGWKPRAIAVAKCIGAVALGLVLGGALCALSPLSILGAPIMIYVFVQIPPLLLLTPLIALVALIAPFAGILVPFALGGRAIADAIEVFKLPKNREHLEEQIQTAIQTLHTEITDELLQEAQEHLTAIETLQSDNFKAMEEQLNAQQRAVEQELADLTHEYETAQKNPQNARFQDGLKSSYDTAYQSIQQKLSTLSRSGKELQYKRGCAQCANSQVAAQLEFIRSSKLIASG